MMDGMLSSETIRAAALVGRSVLVPGQRRRSAEGCARWRDAGRCSQRWFEISIMDATGREVASIDMGALQASTYSFRWDSTAVDGNTAAGSHARSWSRRWRANKEWRHDPSSRHGFRYRRTSGIAAGGFAGHVQHVEIRRF